LAESDEKEDPADNGPELEPETEGLAGFEALVPEEADPPELEPLLEPEVVSDEEPPARLAVAEKVEAPPVAEAPKIIASLRKRLTDKDADLAKIVAAYRKLKEESEGFRKRMEQLQRRRLEQSKGDFIARFVEVLDNLDRAIDSIENNFDADSVLQGIILVRSRLVALLREEGLEKIFVGGQPFDPMHSEAAGIEPVDDASQDNMVIREVQRGYMLKGSLLRPSRVIVGRYQAEGEETPEDPTAAAGDTTPSEDSIED